MEREIQSEQVCSRCKQDGSRRTFTPASDGSTCKTCDECRAQKSRSAKNDPVKTRSQRNASRRRHPETVRAASKRYAKKHSAALNAKSAKWAAAHPERAKEIQRKSNAKQREYHRTWQRAARARMSPEALEHKRELSADWRRRNPEWGRMNYRRSYARDPIAHLATNAIGRAKVAGLPYDYRIIDELKSYGMPRVCPIYGIPIIPVAGPVSANKPSIDRIIPRLGYVCGNVRIVSWKANTDKSNLGIQQLRQIAKYIKTYSRHEPPTRNQSDQLKLF